MMVPMCESRALRLLRRVVPTAPLVLVVPVVQLTAAAVLAVVTGEATQAALVEPAQAERRQVVAPATRAVTAGRVVLGRTSLERWVPAEVGPALVLAVLAAPASRVSPRGQSEVRVVVQVGRAPTGLTLRRRQLPQRPERPGLVLLGLRAAMERQALAVVVAVAAVAARHSVSSVPLIVRAAVAEKAASVVWAVWPETVALLVEDRLQSMH